MDALDVFRSLSQPRRAAQAEADDPLFRTATRHTLQLDGNTLAGWSWGAAGPRVLLVHGWESQAAHLAHSVSPLLDAGYQVWAFDGPAHGASTGDRASVVHFGKAILKIDSACSPFAGLVAHSMGSPAALYAFRHGMRVGSSAHIAGPASLQRVLERVAHAVTLDATQTERLLSMMEAHIGQPIATMDLEALADGMRHPALLLHDPADPEVPYSESRLLAGKWAGARLVDVAQAGHRRIVRHPDTIAAVLGHLETTIPVREKSLDKSVQ